MQLFVLAVYFVRIGYGFALRVFCLCSAFAPRRLAFALRLLSLCFAFALQLLCVHLGSLSQTVSERSGTSPRPFSFWCLSRPFLSRPLLGVQA